jgi:D-sedoheptulose 7-phosphate isomerase
MRTEQKLKMAKPFAESYKTAFLEALETVDLGKVEAVIRIFEEARSAGKTIFVCGNGGSSSNASHFTTEVVKGASYGKSARFRILSLADSAGTITAYGNDCGFESVFAEQLKNFARPGDIVMAMSGSGNSPNAVAALEYANSAGCFTIALTGRDGGKLGRLAQLEIRVAHPHMGRIEDCHMMVLHMISYRFMEE